MSDYGDPELLIAGWIVSELGIACRADPNLRPDSWAMAPVAHVQRGQGAGRLALTLDDCTLDVDVYSSVAAHARETAQRIWVAMTLELPLTTFENGIFVTHVSATTAPCWAPDPSAFRRTAAYRVILHGLI